MMVHFISRKTVSQTTRSQKNFIILRLPIKNVFPSFEILIKSSCFQNSTDWKRFIQLICPMNLSTFSNYLFHINSFIGVLRCNENEFGKWKLKMVRKRDELVKTI